MLCTPLIPVKEILAESGLKLPISLLIDILG